MPRQCECSFTCRVDTSDRLQYLDNFSRALASDVLVLLSEVGKLREERRIVQQCVLSEVQSTRCLKKAKSRSELGSLLCLKSKYGPGGEFNSDR